MGPLPPPGILSGYEEMVPGAAERILAWTEEETQHRRKLERRAMDAQIEGMRREFWEVRRGQVLGAAVVFIFVFGGAYVAVHGYPWPGTVLGGTGMTAIVTAFIYGRHGNYREHDKSKRSQADQQSTKRQK